MRILTEQDISVLKYYKEGNTLCGFERVHDNLCNLNYLNDDLELTLQGRDFINNVDNWESIKVFSNETLIKVKI